MTDAERGRLFVAMLEYAESGAEPQLSGSERYVWPAARQSINNTREKSEQMKANGSKPKQTEANESKTEQTEAKPSRLFDKEKDKDKQKDKDKSKRALTRSQRPSAEDDRAFEKFWLVYPRHEGKQAARKAFARLKVDDALLGVMVNAITRQRGSDQWSDPRYIPYPATWLNGRRWEDEPVQTSGNGAGKRVSAQQYEQRDYDEAELERRLGVDL